MVSVLLMKKIIADVLPLILLQIKKMSFLLVFLQERETKKEEPILPIMITMLCNLQIAITDYIPFNILMKTYVFEEVILLWEVLIMGIHLLIIQKFPLLFYMNTHY